MKFTNQLNFPEEIFLALTKDRYDADDDSGNKTDYSATTLVAPIQQTILMKRHSQDLVEDAVSRIWVLFGNIAHSLLEEHGSDDALVEQRFYINVLGKTISGKTDHYKNGKISDYKVTSVYKIQKKSFIDWETQLNIYAYIYRQHGLKVDSIRVLAILRDWQESHQEIPNYPSAPIVEIPLNLWKEEDIEAYITTRVNLLIWANDLTDRALPMCSPEEKWQQPSRWAVMKEGNTRASKCFDESHAANQWRLAQKDYEKMSVVERIGDRRRCMRYCPVASVCHQKAREDGNIKE